mgnify:CR=1 FL=1|jgi:signal peptidase II
MKFPWSLGITAALVFAADRISKVLMFEILSQHSSIWVIPPFFNFSLVLNRGTAFGLFQNSIPILIVVSLLVLAGIGYFYMQEKKPTLLFHLSLGFLLGGALGNLFDRIFLGYVIDFINFTFWPTFNLADVSIDVGIVGLVLYYYVFNKKAVKKNLKKG